MSATWTPTWCATSTAPEVEARGRGARRSLDALEAGKSEILADEVSRRIKQNLSAEPGVYLVPPGGLSPRPEGRHVLRWASAGKSGARFSKNDLMPSCASAPAAR